MARRTVWEGMTSRTALVLPMKNLVLSPSVSLETRHTTRGHLGKQGHIIWPRGTGPVGFKGLYAVSVGPCLRAGQKVTAITLLQWTVVKDQCSARGVEKRSACLPSRSVMEWRTGLMARMSTTALVRSLQVHTATERRVERAGEGWEVLDSLARAARH